MGAKKWIFVLCAWGIPFALPSMEPGIKQERGAGEVKAVQYDNGDWELRVKNKPWFIRGVNYTPVWIGEDPGKLTMRDWTYYDENHNGKNDLLYDVWLDKNGNNVQDPEEKPVGDFQILKEMGCNTLRAYHFPSNRPELGDVYKVNSGVQLQFGHAPNKEVLREISARYGMRFIIGNYVGSWTIGAGTTWEEGCDYTNSKHLENIRKSVRAMVEDSKDEPYILFWMLGNENNVATWSRCNAKEHKAEYYKFVNELAKMIHGMDPNHPVAICEAFVSGDLFDYKKYLPDIDIFGFNTYNEASGYAPLWKSAKSLVNRPVFLSEYGLFAYNSKDGVNEDQQLANHRGAWSDIWANRAGGNGAGNSIGGTPFDWLDRWYMNGQPDAQNPGTNPWPFGPDHIEHAEYWGLASMGDGKDNLFKRQLRKVCEFYREAWTRAAP